MPTKKNTQSENKNKKIKLTPKQQKFCDEYLIDCNATQAAIRAGYSKRTAYRTGCDNLKLPHIRAYIDERMEKHQSELIATQEEVLRYLTSVLRGESEAEDLAVEGTGKGFSKARNVRKAPSELDRLKAAEQLSKCYGLYTKEKIEIEREKLAIEKERLEIEKRKSEEAKADKDVRVVIAGFEEDWTK